MKKKDLYSFPEVWKAIRQLQEAIASLSSDSGSDSDSDFDLENGGEQNDQKEL